jgi:hypothetical protein
MKHIAIIILATISICHAAPQSRFESIGVSLDDTNEKIIAVVHFTTYGGKGAQTVRSPKVPLGQVWFVRGMSIVGPQSEWQREHSSIGICSADGAFVTDVARGQTPILLLPGESLSVTCETLRRDTYLGLSASCWQLTPDNLNQVRFSR